METETKIKRLLSQELNRGTGLHPVNGDKLNLHKAIESFARNDITSCCCIHDCYGNFSSNGYCPCLRSHGGFASPKTH